jgi:hypothetical protein
LLPTEEHPDRLLIKPAGTGMFPFDLAGFKMQDAIEAGDDRYAFSTRTGDLLMVMPREDDEAVTPRLLLLPCPPPQTGPLVATARGPIILLNDTPVGIDLTHPGATELRDSDSSRFASVKVLLLGEDEELAAGLLSKCPQGLFIMDGTDRHRLSRPVRETIIANHPVGLLLRDGQAARRIVRQSPGVRYLAMYGKMPDEKFMGNLEVLWLLGTEQSASATQPGDALPPEAGGEGDDSMRSIDLPDLGSLQGLVVGEDVTLADPKQLRQLEDLRHLAMSGATQEAITTIAAVSTLESLVLSGCEDVRDLSPLRKLNRLRELILLGPPAEVEGIDALRECNALEFLLVDDEMLNAESIEQLKEARPEMRVEGFCLGSRWILAMLPVGLAGGLLFRSRRVSWRTRA